MQKNDHVPDKSEELKRYFRKTVPNKIQALKQAKENLIQGDHNALQTIRKQALFLRGSATTYGYPEISREAAAVEDATEKDLPKRLTRLVDTLSKIQPDSNNATLSPEPVAQETLLLIDPDKKMQSLFHNEMEQFPEWTLLQTGSMKEAEQILSHNHISLVILELDLEDGNGLPLITQIRENPSTHVMPIIVVTSKPREFEIECYLLGTNVFFTKPVDIRTIFVVIESKLKEINKFKNESHKDFLTGLPNRAAFCEDYSRVCSLASRMNKRLSLAIMDVDHFKGINDTYGHAIGDQVLKEFGKLLTDSFRRYDCVARWGGEEFVALLIHDDEHGAFTALENTHRQYKKKVFTSSEGRTFSSTFSAGLAEVTEDMSLEMAMAQADRQLYMAKSSGRDRIISANGYSNRPTMNVLLIEEDDLMAALVDKYFSSNAIAMHRIDDSSQVIDFFQKDNVESFSLIILDAMPLGQMNGFEVLKWIKQQPQLKDIPVIMLTTAGKKEHIFRAFEVGADDYVVKPFEPLELVARSHRLMKSTPKPKKAD